MLAQLILAISNPLPSETPKRLVARLIFFGLVEYGLHNFFYFLFLKKMQFSDIIYSLICEKLFSNLSFHKYHFLFFLKNINLVLRFFIE